MRPRGYRASDRNIWFDPRTGRVVDFDTFLKIADQIAGIRDRAEALYDRTVATVREGVGQSRTSYWRRALSARRASLAEANAFYREIDEQLSRPVVGERARGIGTPRSDRQGAERLERTAPPARVAPQRSIEFELNLDYDASLGAVRSSEVDISIRFMREDREPMTMDDAWEAVNHYRLYGEFPDEFDVHGIDWLGAAAKRRGRRKTVARDAATVADAVHDFYNIIHAVDRADLDVHPLRLGSVKEDG